jgi:pseudouridine synthase
MNPKKNRPLDRSRRPFRRGAPEPRERGELARAPSAPAEAAEAFVDPESGDAESPAADEPVLVRLNKYLADHGVASRRKCDELIAAGQVTIDGNITTQLGQTIDPARHTVEIDGFVLKPQGLRRRYYLLNKPAGVVCTNEARETRPRAVDLITDGRKGRIYTVGRLDEESKGLILLTNDGEFANRIMHPRYGVEKTYLVRVAGKIDDAALAKIREGVHLAEGRTAGARVLVNKRLRDQSLLTLTLREGMNREIRRSFAQVGYKVLDLKRTRIGPLSDRGIKIGRWRELTGEEVQALLAGRNESLERRFGNHRGGRHDRKPRSGASREHGSAPFGRNKFRKPKLHSGWRELDRKFGRERQDRDRKLGADRQDRDRQFGAKRADRGRRFGAERTDRERGFGAERIERSRERGSERARAAGKRGHGGPKRRG